MRIDGREIVVERSGANPSVVFIDGDLPPRIRRRVVTTEAEPRPHLSNATWRDLLGLEWFGIDAGADDELTMRPRFRQIFAYIARRERSSAFEDPRKQFPNQGTGDQQVALMFLLRQDWRIASDFETLRRRATEIQQLARRRVPEYWSEQSGRRASFVPNLQLLWPELNKPKGGCRRSPLFRSIENSKSKRAHSPDRSRS